MNPSEPYALDRTCPAARHRWAGDPMSPVAQDVYNPDCGSCSAHRLLTETHNHLHLNPDFVCETPGLRGEPGVMVKCRCGAYHH